MEEQKDNVPPDSDKRQSGIVDRLSEKSALTQKIFDNTFSVFNDLKDLLNEMSSEINDEMDERDQDTKIEYRDRGKFEAQIQVADDLLIFSMHTNIFKFNNEHPIWENDYVCGNKENAYCGIINIYDFLADSFKYNRNGDEGYLIGRIFVNQTNHYCVEGKRQDSLRAEGFGSREISKDSLREIVEAAIGYAIDFDLLVPQYENAKIVTVDQLNTKMEHSKIRTGKRLGYLFRSDDV